MADVGGNLAYVQLVPLTSTFAALSLTLNPPSNTYPTTPTTSNTVDTSAMPYMDILLGLAHLLPNPPLLDATIGVIPFLSDSDCWREQTCFTNRPQSVGDY